MQRSLKLRWCICQNSMRMRRSGDLRSIQFFIVLPTSMVQEVQTCLSTTLIWITYLPERDFKSSKISKPTKSWTTVNEYPPLQSKKHRHRGIVPHRLLRLLCFGRLRAAADRQVGQSHAHLGHWCASKREDTWKKERRKKRKEMYLLNYIYVGCWSHCLKWCLIGVSFLFETCVWWHVKYRTGTWGLLWDPSARFNQPNWISEST